jgi:hypothetical protein
VLASLASTDAGAATATIASSSGATAAGAADCAAIACASPVITAAGYMSALIGCSASANNSAGASVLLASQNAVLWQRLCLATGYAAGAYGAIGAANQNLTFKIDVLNGVGYADGGFAGGAADYAELFENAAHGVLPAGALVAGDGERVRLATKGDRVRGIVSAAPGIIGNSASLGWAGKWARDEFGTNLRETHSRVAWKAQTRPSAARATAEAAAEEARLAFVAAANAAMCAGPSADDQRKHCAAPSAELSDAWKALAPWKRPRSQTPARVPGNEGHWQRYERAQAAVTAADKAMRAEVEERIAGALANLKTVEAQWQTARSTAKACCRDVEIVREAFDGMEADAPQPIPEDAKRYSVEARKVADGYDPAKPYTDRIGRPEEWTVVGLMGQILTRVDDTVEAGDFIEAGDVPGVGTKSKKETRLEVLRVTVPFDAAKGYGVAKVLRA